MNMKHHNLFDKPLSCFITGTDTEIGKTLVASAIVHKQAQIGYKVVGMKPVAAGATLVENAWHNDDVDALMDASSVKLDQEMVCPYLFSTPVAPHIASHEEGRPIDPKNIINRFNDIQLLCDAVVVEGVGGFRVPLTQDFDTADLAVELALPVILVVGLRLGCINHALLSIESIETRGLNLIGWVANSISNTMDKSEDNLKALQERIHAPFLAHIPYLNSPTFVNAAEFF